ncbi:MAG: adenosine kinase [Prolixibacteraceae bacterium]|jgi:sugar/nucleoside kinase (ribokinase family)|nr:adenosine kinase [Prolixibacteraceae bacterium]
MGYSKILGIGNALVDIITMLDNDKIIRSLSLPKGSMTLVDREMSDRVQMEIEDEKRLLVTGGSVANAINGVANLGVPCGFLGTVGKDELGKLFEGEQISQGIKPLLIHSDLPTGRAVGLVEPDGERTFATYLGAASELHPDDITPERLKGFDIFFVEGYLVYNHALIMAAAVAAKNAGLTIALDLASYNVVEANREILNELVDNYVDIVFANEEEAKAFTGVEPLEAVGNLAGRCDIAVVKVGKEGAYIQQGAILHKIPAAGDLVVDTTGAGDFFAAGFLSGIAKGYDLEKSGKLGALLASRVIRVPGAKLPEEEWVEIRKIEDSL